MLDIAAFTDCIRMNLKDRKYGKERGDKIVADFEARAEKYRAEGKPIAEAGTLAMKDTFENMSKDTLEKTKRTAKTLSVLAEGAKRIEEGLQAKSIKGGRGNSVGHAVKSLVIPDKRFTGFNIDDAADVRLGHAYAVWGDAADKILKGVFGMQKGKAHLPNVVREVFGARTGDDVARQLAEGWIRTADFLVDEFNAAGGSMSKLDRYLPQPQSAVKLLKQGKDTWVSDHMNWLDWGRMRRPDGSTIPVEERQAVLEAVYDTLSTDGVNKIDPTAFRGQGRSIGNALDEHRFLHYKDAEGWLAAQDKYGEGNVFDVLNHHIGAMTHRTAVVEMLGPNPELSMKTIQNMAKKKVEPQLKHELEGVFKNVVDPALERIMHTNPMNPESTTANIAGISSNISTAAVMGKAVLASMLGDPTTTAVIRRLNGMPMFGGFRFYFEALRSAAGDLAGHLGADTLDRNVGRNIALTSGWVFKSSISHTSLVERFNRTWSMPNAISRRVADNTLRASGMNITTNAARFRAQGEMSAFLFRASQNSFDDMPTKMMFQRYGINAQDWDAFRNIQPYNPEPGINMLRPIDVLKSDLPTARKDELFRKFQTMILSEARGMVPDSTVEAALTLKGNTRPDTLPGLLLHSFTMFKNFPMTYAQMYAQYALSLSSGGGRAKFIASMMGATTIAGAMAVQLGEIQSGRDPMDMTRGDFLLKAFSKGGGAGVWGDFMLSFLNTGSKGSLQMEGPALGLISGAMGIIGNEMADAYDAHKKGEDYDSKAPQRLVDYIHRYFPGSNLWYSQQVLNKLFWENLENAADPQASQRRQRKMDRQKQDYGNEYYWKLGEPTPDRAPDLSNAVGGEQ